MLAAAVQLSEWQPVSLQVDVTVNSVPWSAYAAVAAASRLRCCGRPTTLERGGGEAGSREAASQAASQQHSHTHTHTHSSSSQPAVSRAPRVEGPCGRRQCVECGWAWLAQQHSSTNTIDTSACAGLKIEFTMRRSMIEVYRLSGTKIHHPISILISCFCPDCLP
jgi:hypothetical protein